jgi:hypothetical protein
MGLPAEKWCCMLNAEIHGFCRAIFTSSIYAWIAMVVQDHLLPAALALF